MPSCKVFWYNKDGSLCEAIMCYDHAIKMMLGFRENPDVASYGFSVMQ